jgi:transcriptional regulator with XRE-family HTH domain
VASENRDIRGDIRGQIREFLTTRRARITPEQARLPAYGGSRRRVSGLRRDEVAFLAGISSQYYTRLERGSVTGVSESVIDGIARALQLDEAEQTHLLDLIHAASTTRARRGPAPQQVRSTVQRVLDSMIGTPALVLNGRLDILAPPTSSGSRCSHRSLPTRSGRPTMPASSSSTRKPPSSSVTGTRPPTTRSPSCAPRPDATPTTGASSI